MASRSICRARGENIDNVDDRFLTEPCCVVFKKSFVLGECDRINASLKTSLILIEIYQIAKSKILCRNLATRRFFVHSRYEKGGLNGREDIRLNHSDDKLVSSKLVQILGRSMRARLKRNGEQKFRNANAKNIFSWWLRKYQWVKRGNCNGIDPFELLLKTIKERYCPRYKAKYNKESSLFPRKIS